MPLTTRPAARPRGALQPITASMLPELAAFLGPERHEDAAGTERYLYWLLVENPLAAGAEHHGYCARDAAGALSGVLLSFPAVFQLGEQRLVALGFTGFLVTPEARGTGFFLFKRLAATPGYTFFFSTTCNTASGALWKRLGGIAAPGSDVEYVVPFHLDVLLPAFLASRTANGYGAGLAGLVGRCANPVVRGLAWTPRRFRVEPTRDWDRLAALAQRHRDGTRLTPERSAAYLRWRYGDAAPNRPFDLVVFRDARGDEGWLALGSVVRGRLGQVHGRVVLDAVWPRQTMSSADLVAAAVQVAAPTADVLYLQPPCGLDVGRNRFSIPWRLEGPRAFVMPGRGRAPLAASAFDLVPGAGDSAF